jgi:predicted RNase H-like nuclease
VKRLPYKASKVRSYWPDLPPKERRYRLYGEWRAIVEKLEAEMSGVSAALPKLDIDASGVAIKAYEDTLDAMICAWVGIRALQGRATPFGDGQSAIWVPKQTA